MSEKYQHFEKEPEEKNLISKVGRKVMEFFKRGEVAVERITEGDVELNFLLVTHTSDNAKKIGDALRDADIIAMEYVGGSQKVREKDRETVQQVLDSGEEPESLKRNFGFLATLARHLAGTKKELVFIDVGEKDKEYEAVRSYQIASNKFDDKAFKSPMPEVKQLFLDEAKITAALDALREDLVAGQLKDLVSRTGRDNRMIKIGVMQGALHSETSHRFLKDPAYKTSRQFLTQRGPNEKAAFTYQSQLVRELRFFPDREPGETLINRALLEHYTTRRAIFFLKDPSVIEGHEFAKGFVKSLREEEVKKYLEHIGQLNEQSGEDRSYRQVESFIDAKLGEWKSRGEKAA